VLTRQGDLPMTRRSVLFLLMTLALCGVGGSCSPSRNDNTPPREVLSLHGAGATFPAPLYEQWLAEYHKRHPEVHLRYEAIGSGGGILRFMAEAVDFGASDAAMTDGDMAQVGRGVQLVPVVAGSIVLAYHLPEWGGTLRLTRDVYADIFLGKITRWDDPRIQTLNPAVALPSTAMTVVVRQDGSGTTFALTNHLSAVSAEWRDRGPGTGRLVDWPAHSVRVPGNEGVAAHIQQTPGAIGYVEYGLAKRMGLTMAWLENKAGQLMQPHGGSGLASLLQAALPENLRAFFPDPDGPDSYPIVTYSWLLLYKRYNDPQKVAALKRFVTWCLTEGQAFSEPLGYVRLAPQVATRAVDALRQVQ
jgi:phosphate transport system substrate-binding protein